MFGPYLAVVVVRKRVHDTEIRTGAASVELGEPLSHPLRPGPVFAADVAGEEGHIPEHLLVEEVRVAEPFTMEHINSSQDYAVSTRGDDKPSLILAAL